MVETSSEETETKGKDKVLSKNLMEDMFRELRVNGIRRLTD